MGVGELVGRTAERLDEAQQRRPLLAVPFAVAKKFGDDHGGRWAALVAYYGFLSIFPLLLALTTVLALVVEGDPELQQRVLDSALSQFPIVGGEIRENLGALSGSWLALAIGVAGALWGGMGIVLALGEAMDDVWDVPRRARRGFLPGRLRALAALALLGAAMVASGVLTGLSASAGGVGGIGRVLSLLGTLLLNLVVIGAAFRYLTSAEVAWRHVIPGAIVAAIAWMALLAIGTWLVDRQLRDATALYGFFAIVLGLLSWIYLGAQVLLLSAELNVVLARRLWPRSLQPPP